ncbi:MAG: DNA-binding protein [Halobacteria archaeon]|nr:DNA-binding protein [Halobacteria archaeon]
MTDDIDDLREEKLKKLKEQQGEGQSQEREEREEAEAQKKALLKQTLTAEARERLNTLRMSKPEFAESVEQQIVALAKSGRIQDTIDDDQMKDLLRELQPSGNDYNIKRR